MSHLPVLIVGAGPTGLMMACELARHGIEFRIIDKNAQPTKGSNATWIQTRTLEIFDAIGMVDPFLRSGHQCHSINFYDQGKCLANLPLKNINSAFPFILMLPQRDTERLLNERLEKLGVHLERSSELINIEQVNNKVISTIKLLDGNTETVISDWVVACDGANSTIREKTGISFPGEDIPEQFMVADAVMSSFLPTDEIHVFFDKGTIFPKRSTIFSAFPWGSKYYRLTANLYNETPRQSFNEHEVKEIVAERTYGNYIVENVSWISPFWVHGKLVDNMRCHSIFILGDAAHIHSPAGGQGMNTGIQDAYNLAWKLALTIKKRAKPIVLESFPLERYPIVKGVVKKTNHLTNMMLFDKDFFPALHKFSEALISKEKVKKIGENLTQLDILYKESPIIDYQEKTSTNTPKPGERFPDIRINNANNLYHYFLNNKYNVLLFTGKQTKVDEMVLECYKKISAKFNSIANIILISQEDIKEVNVVIDDNCLIHDQFGIRNKTVFIIRPDNYICYFSEKFDFEKIEFYFNEYLNMS